MNFYNCLVGFLVIVGCILLFILVLILLSCLIFFVQYKCGCFDDFVKIEDLKSCCFGDKYYGKND
ncbi:MAG: hypothetical protein J6J11_08130 [Treponema sp.]|nr:hypothetical protein [Clostridia bacterium]MBP3608270.1 hypothetical protein [Treponema sp.]